MKITSRFFGLFASLSLFLLSETITRLEAGLALVEPAGPDDFVLFDGTRATALLVETNEDRAVARAAADLAGDVQAVTGVKPALINDNAGAGRMAVIIGTLGQSKIVDQLADAGKLDVAQIKGQWESTVWQVVKNPLPGVDSALVIAGSDRRGTIYGIYQVSETIGVSPWHWWADVPVTKKKFLALKGGCVIQGPPAVKYRGIFLNDEDWGLRPWASKTLEPENGNIGPKTYAKIFELMLRLRANYLWPAMHPGTAAFNSFPTDKDVAGDYGVVMGSSHCEQMLRNNISEWDDKTRGEYNFVTNPDGVLKYWEERVRENSQYENVYTLGMRGISDGAMPGGGTSREKAARLHTIIADQRAMLAHWVNTNVAAVPQIFCPYKEVLGLYRLMPDLPDDITLVWPDDNYGYIREFSNPAERARRGGAGVYYHVSYWGRPRDYLWLCSTPPALIAEEMTKAYAYGANKVWMLNVGDLKPAELDIEFFLKLAWNPGTWNGTNASDLLEQQLARDFGPESAPELTSILDEYYRLNFQRKPEHMGYPATNLFTIAEAMQRLACWDKLSTRISVVEKQLPPELHDAFYELIEYPARVAALENEKILAREQAASAQGEIDRLTDVYNNQIAGGKWHLMMSDNPRGQMNFGPPKVSAESFSNAVNAVGMATNCVGADFYETNGCVIMAAAQASAFIPGKAAHWQKITGLGYNGESVSVFPVTAAVRSTPADILRESPCLEYKVSLQSAGIWKIVVRALPTFSVETGKPQRYAVALDDEPPQIISLPYSMSETDRHWQENVLRNAALTTSTHTATNPGLHTLKIWMVDPGIVIDSIGAETDASLEGDYVWPGETRNGF